MKKQSSFRLTHFTCIRSALALCALPILATIALVPAAFSFAEGYTDYRVASLNDETAGGVARYEWDGEDISDMTSDIIGVFDIFGGDDSDELEDDFQAKALLTHPDDNDIDFHEDHSISLEDAFKEKGVVEHNLYEVLFSDSHSEEDMQSETALNSPMPVPHTKPEAMRNDQVHIEEEEQHLDAAASSIPVPAPRPFLAYGKGLDQKNAALYKNVFSLQAAGKMKEADQDIRRLTDLRLRGHVLYQRYIHPTSYVTNFDELRNWLVLYSDLPGARRIYNLALRKKPADFDGHLMRPAKVKTIVRRREPAIYYGVDYRSKRKRSSAQKEKVAEIGRVIKSLLRRDRFTLAYEKLSSSDYKKHLDTVEFDNLRAKIAEGYLHHGAMDKAYDLASASAKRSGEYVPLAGWIAGLVSWGHGQHDKAATYFAYPARSRFGSSWTQSAGSFWAARANMRAGRASQARGWLRESMKHPRTFYGLIAARALGKTQTFNWDFPDFTKAHGAMLLNTPQGKRAADLVAAGQIHMAEAELLQLNPKTPKMQEALLSYAGYAGLPALAIRAGSAFEGPNGRYYDAALYPKGSWKARSDYKIDPDLMHAIMRQESKFDARAESRSGALGLMQIMPTTASFISGKRHMKSRTGQEQLLDPDTNLALGQKYIEFLLKNKHVNDDMINMLISYNAGPGNLRRWKKRWSGIQDSLLFIELIPARETRAYVERVLANYWIYRSRAGLETPTLDALAKGRKALYADAQKARDRTRLFKIAQTP